MLKVGSEQNRNPVSKQSASIPSGTQVRGKRGPKPDYETATRVDAIVRNVAPDGDWRPKLDEVCEALDQDGIPCPPRWRGRCQTKCWSDYPEKSTAVKAIEGRPKPAKQKPQPAFETRS